MDNSDDELSVNINSNVRPYMYEPGVDELPSESESGSDSSESDEEVGERSGNTNW